MQDSRQLATEPTTAQSYEFCSLEPFGIFYASLSEEANLFIFAIEQRFAKVEFVDSLAQMKEMSIKRLEWMS
jgi:hypothetical protein